MSQGTAIYSVKGNLVYPLGFAPVCPVLHGDSVSGYSLNPVFIRVEDSLKDKKTTHAGSEEPTAGRFFLWHGADA